jgi:hypothetical protein
LQIEGDDFGSDNAGRLSAYVSFGGLLMRMQVYGPKFTQS